MEMEMYGIKLIHGEMLEVMGKLPEHSVDAIIADLPYGTTKCKWDVIIPIVPLWEQFSRIRRDKTPVVLFGVEPFSSMLRTSNLKNFKYDWIWDKVTARGHLVAKKRPMQQHEILSVFYEHNYYPIMVDRPKNKIKMTKEYSRTEIMGGKVSPNYKNYDTWYPKTIITFSNASRLGKVHPTQKPVELCEYLIKTYTNEGDTVGDFCFGSGTTAVACVNTGRKFIGCELEKKYFDIAVGRVKKAIEEKEQSNGANMA